MSKVPESISTFVIDNETGRLREISNEDIEPPPIKFYIRRFHTSGTKTSMTVNLNNNTLVNWKATTNNSIALPSDYRHFLSLTINGVAVKMIQIDDHEALRTDPFNAPSLANPACTLTDSGIFLYPTTITGSSIATMRLTYLAWDESSDDIENLPDHTHEEIVNIAVRKLMANTKDDA